MRILLESDSVQYTELNSGLTTSVTLTIKTEPLAVSTVLGEDSCQGTYESMRNEL